MTRVLHIIDHPGLGGAQRLVDTILKNREGDQVFPLHAKPPHLIQSTGQLLYPAKSLFITAGRILRLPALLKKNRIQVVHCHLTISWIVGLWLSRMPGVRRQVKFIFHAHDSENMQRMRYRILSRWVAKAGKIISVSGYILQQFTQMGVPLERLILLLNFLDLELYSSTAKADSNFSLDPQWAQGYRLVGYAGRLTASKGLEALLDCIRILQDEKLKFLIAGMGPYEQHLAEWVTQSGLQDKVKIFGFIDHLAGFLQSIDVFISPSLSESFGLVQLEAQACGCTVAAFDLAALRETLGENGALFAPLGDSPALAKCVQQAAFDPALRQQLLERGQKNVRRFSAVEHLQKLEQIYRDETGEL